MELEKKWLGCHLEKAAVDGQTISGAAACMGNLDRGSDVILPGAFKDCLQQLLTSGFVAANHDWTWEGMKAMPKVAEERGSKLYTEAIFHSTPDAQDIRTKCMERIANNLSVGLSIGFGIMPDSTKTFRSGVELLAYARSKGYDMSLFDVEGIQAHKGYCRAIIKIDELFEYSAAAVPMNPLAVADDVKGARNVTPEGEKGASGSTTLPVADPDHASDAGGADNTESKEMAKVGEDALGEIAEHAKAMKMVTDALSGMSEMDDGSAEMCDAVEKMPDHAKSLAAVKSGLEKIHAAYTGDTAGKDDTAGKSFERFTARVLKGQYLGENVEARAVINVLDSLQWAVYCNVADVLFDYDGDNDSPDEKMAVIGGIFDEFTSTALKIIKAILLTEDGAKARETAGLLRRPAPPEMKDLTVDTLPATGMTLAAHSASLLASTAELSERLKSHAALRMKDGRVLSQANRDRIAAHVEGLKAICDDLSALLQSAGGTEPDDNTGTMALNALKAKALGHKCDLTLLSLHNDS
jgi:hypothetical protein